MPKYTLYWEQARDIMIAQLLLRGGGVLLASTDTVYGLLAPFTEEGKAKLDTLKGAREHKPYLVLIASPQKLSRFVDDTTFPPSLNSLIAHVWPGPVTIVFRAQPTVPAALCTSTGTIALRCPDHAGLQELLQPFDGVFSTSANTSGQPVPQGASDIEPQLLKSVDSFIDVVASSLDKMPPSTIIDCTNPDNITLVREGAVALTQLEKIYGTQIKRKNIPT